MMSGGGIEGVTPRFRLFITILVGTKNKFNYASGDSWYPVCLILIGVDIRLRQICRANRAGVDMTRQ